MKNHYLNLKTRAPYRLQTLRTLADKMNAQPWRASADPVTWRDVRRVTFKTVDYTPAYGLNENPFNGREKLPVIYSHDGEVFNRELWIDEVENSHVDHTGWFADPDCCDTMRGFIVRLPHGRMLAGYESSDNGERVYFVEIFTDQYDAIQHADSMARETAEREREYQTRYLEAQEKRDDIETSFTRLRECLALRNNACFAHLRDEVRDIIESIRDTRETLATDYADIEI